MADVSRLREMFAQTPPAPGPASYNPHVKPHRLPPTRRTVIVATISLLALAPTARAAPQRTTSDEAPPRTAPDLRPPPPGAIVIHVSSTEGVDGRDGRSPETAVKTVRRGQALIRNNHGDRLLLKCGDTFSETFGNWNKSGHSPEAPLVIGSYGDGPRPIVRTRQGAFNLYGNQPVLHDVIISNIHFLAPGRDPEAADFDPASECGMAIRIVRPVHRLTIQDCRFELFQGNLALTGDKSKGRLQDIALRRCVVLDAYSTEGAHSGQGVYADKVDGLTIEDCVFDHNGWHEKVPGATPNIFRHNIYISADTSGVRVTGCVIARGASHGMQMRSGGLCEGNLFVDNAIHALLAGEEATFRNNVILGGRDIDEKNPRGFGVTIAAGRGLIEDNLIVHKPATAGGAVTVEVGKWSPKTGVNAVVRNNVIYDWAGNGLEVVDEIQSLAFEGNDVQRIGKGRKVLSIKKAVGSMTFAGNRYDGQEPRRERWFALPEGYLAPQDWARKTGDTSQLADARYPAPDRRLPNDFLGGVRDEQPGYTTAAAINRLREAFGKKPSAEKPISRKK